jgi:uncharacterized protein (DUF1499 family)
MRFTRLFFILVFASTTLGGCSLMRAWKTFPGPSDESYKQGTLVDCPPDPNCVSTQASRADHTIVPFTYSKTVDEARQALKGEMSKLDSTTLVKEDGSYLHFECRSRVLRLVDDVEFIFDEETKTLQFRSASRFGFDDWKANRKRMEDLRTKIFGRI